MKKRKNISKLAISIFIALSCTSCGINNVTGSNTDQNLSIKVSDIETNNKISFVIKENNFGTKATSGSINPPKVDTNISYYKVYLLKNSASVYPSSGDPVSDIVSGPFIVNKTSSTQVATFSNAPYSNGNYYYIGVRAYNSSNVEISKLNNSWINSSSGSNSRISVSSGSGRQIDIDNKIIDLSPLEVTINLEDGLGARIDSSFNLVGDPTLPALSGSRYGSGTFDIIAGKSGGLAPAINNEIATDVLLNNPSGVTVDTAGNVYIADTNNNYIEKIDTAGNLKIIAGKSGGSAPTTNNQIATNVALSNPSGVALDSSGNLYIADSGNNYIEKIDTAGNLKIIAGKSGGSAPTTNNQIATNVSLNSPSGVTTDSTNNIYIADTNNNFIEKIDTQGNLKIIAGTASGGTTPSAALISATNAALNKPNKISVDFTGNIYVADTGNNFIEKISTNNALNVIAGNPSGSNPSTNTQLATSVKLLSPNSVAVDTSGNVYIADTGNNFIEKIDTQGNLKIIAGNTTGIVPYSGKPGISIKLNSPNGLGIDTSGNVFITDSGNNYIEMIIQ